MAAADLKTTNYIAAVLTDHIHISLDHLSLDTFGRLKDPGSFRPVRLRHHACRTI